MVQTVKTSMLASLVLFCLFVYTIIGAFMIVSKSFIHKKR